MSSIAFVSVFKRYGEVDAVKHLDLACDAGEMLALLGPSGCGKSTTLKMAAGIESVSSGEIYFGERPVSRLAPGERNIAMVFEDYALYPQMTVCGERRLPAEGARHHRPAGGGADRRRAPAARPAPACRSGRAWAVRRRAAAHRHRPRAGARSRGHPVRRGGGGGGGGGGPPPPPPPLSHLDADQKVQLRAEIKRLQKLRQVTSILVTHDQTEAIAMADRVAVMNHGVLQQVASPQDLYERPANLFVANFIGEPPMNLLPAQVGEGALAGGGWRATLDARRVDLLARRPDAAVVAGIRPEHVVLTAPGETGGAKGTVIYREPRGDADVLTVRLEGEGG